MSGVAVCMFKSSSVLDFDRNAREETAKRSVVRSLFGVDKAPSDPCLRERLDRIDPVPLRSAFRRIVANLQRSKGREHFTILGGYSLLSLDGTGYYRSSKVYGSSCCVKESPERNQDLPAPDDVGSPCPS